MKNNIRNLQITVFILAIVSMLIIIADSIILNFYTEEVVLDPENISNWERLIMIGAVILGSFFLLSMYWLSKLEGEKGRYSAGKILTIIFGLVSIFLLLGEKYLSNQVGEMILAGENIDAMMANIQMLFIVQFIYVILILVEMAAQDNENTFSSEESYKELLHSRDVIAAASSIIPGLGHIYKAHYGTGIGLLIVSPFFVWGGLILGWATFGLGLLIPILYIVLIGWHAYSIDDRRHHVAGIL